MMRRLGIASMRTDASRRTAIQTLEQVGVTCPVWPVYSMPRHVHLSEKCKLYFAALKQICASSRVPASEYYKHKVAHLRETASNTSMPHWEVPAEGKNHLHIVCLIGQNFKSGEEISERLSNESLFKGETDPVQCLTKMKEFFRLLGLGLLNADAQILNDYAERMLKQSTREERVQTLIEYYREEGVNVNRETFMNSLFLYDAATVINMCCMTGEARLGVTAHGHYGQRVDDPKRNKTDPKIFYSPILLPNEHIPTDFEELIALYRKTNTGNIIPKLIEDKKIDLFWIKGDTLTVQQETLVKELGETGYTELISSDNSKQLLETYDASKGVAMLLGKGLVAIMPYENAAELKERCIGIAGAEEEKIEQGFQIARDYVSEVTAKGHHDIRVYQGKKWLKDPDGLQEVLSQQDKQQETELRYD